MIGQVARRAIAAAVLVAWLSLGAGEASARYANTLLDSFPAGSPGESLVLLSAAVDNSSGPSAGDVYVGRINSLDGRSSVAKFGPDGAPIGEFDGSETPAGDFGFLSFETSRDTGIAVDGSAGANSGDVYVADANGDVVDRFDEEGKFICRITGQPAPAPQECNPIVGSGIPGGALEPSGIAVDRASGDLYVTNVATDSVEVFDESGAFVRRISDPRLVEPDSVAVDPSGAIYVSNGALFKGPPHDLVKLDSAGSFVAVIDAEEPIRVATDPVSGHVFVTEGLGEGEVAEFDSSGKRLGSFGATEELLAAAPAISRANGDVYVTTTRVQEGSTSEVEVYSPGTAIPDVTTGDAEAVGESVAVVHAEVGLGGGPEVTGCRFQYVDQGHFEAGARDPYVEPGETSCLPSTPYGEDREVAGELSGLSPSRTYHYRVVATNESGIGSVGNDRVLVTKGPPTVEEESAADLRRDTATLRAKINPHGYHTEFKFEFVDAASYESEGGFSSPRTRSTVGSGLGEGLEPVTASQGIADLEVGTRYLYRAVASSPRGTGFGPAQSFETQPVAVIGGQWAYPHVHGATVEADLDPLELPTACAVEYVPDAFFQGSRYAGAISVPCGTPSAPGVVKAEIGGLASGGTYHYRVVATNSSGTVAGEDQTFQTFAISDFSVRLVDREGNDYTQAGGHPYESITHYEFSHTLVPSGLGREGTLSAFIKDLLTESPPGRIGSSLAVPRCKGYRAEEQRCSGDSQVGTIAVEYFDKGSISTETRAIFSVFAPYGKASRYASVNPYTATDVEVRTGGDYGFTAANFEMTEEARVVGVTARYWGVPADHGHDPERRCPNEESPCISQTEPKPLLRNPTSCAGPLEWGGRADSWQAPGEYVTAATQTPGMTGCEQVPFEPSIVWQPTNPAADSPTGLHVDIHVPQDEDPGGVGAADVRNVVLEAPPNLNLNPAAAQNLVGCSTAQFGLHEEKPDDCPDDSKVGTVRVVTPLLDHPLHGGIFIATPEDNPFGSKFAIYLGVDDPETGVVVKLAGKIEPDGSDGRLTTSFTDNPQLPIEDFELDFFGGSNAVLRTTSACGRFTTSSQITPWSAPASGPAATPSDSYAISHGPAGFGCSLDGAGAPFQPRLAAGSLDPAAGSFSPFLLRVTRDDSTQQISSLTIDPPPGLLGRLAGVAQCPDAALAAAPARTGQQELAAPSCPPGSRIGSVAVTAGAGDTPYRVPGEIYLAGPDRGAPVSMAVVVPAVAGPFDLGNVVVRAPLHVDLKSGEIHVETQSFPTVLAGVPLDIRSIEVRLDRAGFTLNPTSCGAMEVGAGVTSLGGLGAHLETPYRVTGCRRLEFAPELSLRLIGSPRRRSHPSLRTVLRLPRGNSNIAGISLSLPASEFFDNDHIQAICTRLQFAAEDCPADSIYGHARAVSPLLAEPLEGNVYLRSSQSRLPALVADLRGQVHLSVAGQIDTYHGGIRTRMKGIPDAPISRFELTMNGGRSGLLQNSVDLCAEPQHALMRLEAQNGKVRTLRPRVRAQCG
ncbi:MAG TPA: NHL repeat-containing protein [Solirubrobacterales bacterium]|jgi:hypothetical protein|nr:NHL repeat-containing protein [Solirubrobacterales bacterium]